MLNENEKKKPIKKFKVGCIQVAVWKNTHIVGTENMFFPSLTFDKSYKDKDGNWQKTQILKTSDYADLQLALSKAYEYMRIQFREDSKNVI